jgi:hypothetical protein
MVKEVKRKMHRIQRHRIRDEKKAEALKARARKQARQARSADRKVARMEAREMHGKAAQKALKWLKKDVKKLHDSALHVKAQADKQSRKAKSDVVRIQKARNTLNNATSTHHQVVLQEKSYLKQYRVLQEAYMGHDVVDVAAVTISKGSSITPSTKIAQVLNSIAATEQKAAAHKAAASDARAREATEQRKAAKDMQRVHQYTKYLREMTRK